MNELQTSFERLKTLRFPESTDDADLQDLHAELTELDGYIAGLISTKLKGKTIGFDLHASVAPLENLLMKAENSKNQTALTALRNYYLELKAVAEVLTKTP